MTDAINTNPTLSQIICDINLGPNDSVQMRFAALQLAQSMLCKGAAEDYMSQIENIQAEQKKTSEMIAEMRKLQQECKNKGDGATVELSPELVAFMEKNQLPISGQKTEVIDYKCIEGKCGDLCATEGAARTWAKHVPGGHVESVKMPDGNTCYQMVSDDYVRPTVYTLKADDFDFSLQSLTNYQESISNKTQTLMVYLQDYIGQYNSFTQGASAQVSQAMQVLTAVATGR